jgi:hypothetical protein
MGVSITFLTTLYLWIDFENIVSLSKKLTSNVYSGAGVGILKDILSTQQVVRQARSEAIYIVKRLGGVFSRL